LFTTCASAEVIHLKNGRTIWADHAREDGSHVEYDIGDDSYAIPKSTVDRIEAGGVRPDYGSSARGSKDIPLFAPSDGLQSDPALTDKIIHDGRVDADALAAIEQQGNLHLSAQAH
jgi:hypothetical protein